MNKTVTIKVAVGRDKFVDVELPRTRLSKSGNLAVTNNRHRVFDITHVPTGYRLPAWSGYRGVGDAPHDASAFATVGSAKRFMDALDASGIDLSPGDPTHINAAAIRQWIDGYER